MNELPHKPTHETRDLPFGPLALAVLGILLGLGLVIALVAFLYGWLGVLLSGDPPDVVSRVERPVPPEPRLIVIPGAQMRELRNREEALLTSYGWTDAEQGIARIPAARALELAVERGLPGWPAHEEGQP